MTTGRILLASLALGFAAVASASDLDFNLSNSAFRFGYAFPVTDTGLTADVGYLHNEDNGDLLHVGIQIVDDAGQGKEPFTVGLGVRAANVNGTGVNGTAVAIGGFFRYVFPEYNRFALGGAAYIAPSVTAFGDLDGYYEYGLRGEYRVLKRATLYLGVREVRGNFATGGNQTIDDGLNVGISLDF